MENQNVNELKQRRAELLLEIGEEAYAVMRRNEEGKTERMITLSQQVSEIDIQIMKELKLLNSTICPRCHARLTEEMEVCKLCGFPVKKHFAEYTTKCYYCQSPMKETQKFCVVCGKKR